MGARPTVAPELWVNLWIGANLEAWRVEKPRINQDIGRTEPPLCAVGGVMLTMYVDTPLAGPVIDGWSGRDALVNAIQVKKAD